MHINAVNCLRWLCCRVIDSDDDDIWLYKIYEYKF